MKSLLLFAALCTASLALADCKSVFYPEVNYPGPYWGALTYNAATGGYGYSGGLKNKAEAIAEAQRCCANCSVVATFSDSCAAYASNAKQTVNFIGIVDWNNQEFEGAVSTAAWYGCAKKEIPASNAELKSCITAQAPHWSTSEQAETACLQKLSTCNVRVWECSPKKDDK